MSRTLFEHLLSVALVSLLIVIAIVGYRFQIAKDPSEGMQSEVSAIVDQPFVQIEDPFHRALLQDMQGLYYSDRPAMRDSLMAVLHRSSAGNLLKKLETENVREVLTAGKVVKLVGMYVRFLFVYVLVLALTWYGVQTIAVARFVLNRRRLEAGSVAVGTNRGVKQRLVRFALATGKVIALFVLFCPAYVIAYSARTEFSTDALPFMVLLAVLSNGLLITYANKFHAFLLAESRRGYVMTARVKNLVADYSSAGISWRAIFRPIKHFQGHVFDHIFANAQHQYGPTMKEQAAFLVTGLIIIEMALNIHGHLSYELLRQMLYRNYDIVLAVILLIFMTVKLTEIGADLLAERAAARYENREVSTKG